MTVQEPEIYLSHDRYTRLVAALADLKPCPIADRITADQIKIALGEAGDIWPLGIRRDVILAGAEQGEQNIVRVTFAQHRIS